MKYCVRAAKYLVYVSVVFIVVFGVMTLTGYSKITPDMFEAFLASSQARLMGGVLLLLVLLHPIMGYIKRPFKLDFNENRDTIVKMFEVYGFEIAEENEHEVKFRASTTFRRITMMYEDTITITKSALDSKIEGNRKMVVKIVYRLNA